MELFWEILFYDYMQIQVAKIIINISYWLFDYLAHNGTLMLSSSLSLITFTFEISFIISQPIILIAV